MEAQLKENFAKNPADCDVTNHGENVPSLITKGMARLRVLNRMRSWTNGWSRRAMLLGATLLLAAAVCPRAPYVVHHSEHFPHLSSATLAHHLADLSNYASMYPHLESWTIENESSNYTSWRYEVSYLCGARCEGRTALSAHEGTTDKVLAHGASHLHRVHVRDTRCSYLPFLPWPPFCEKTETETLIVGEADGARLQETARAYCGRLAALLSRCADGAALRTARLYHIGAIRDALVPLSAHI